MKAAVLREVNVPLEVEEVQVDAPGPARGADPHRGQRRVPQRPSLR